MYSFCRICNTSEYYLKYKFKVNIANLHVYVINKYQFKFVFYHYFAHCCRIEARQMTKKLDLGRVFCIIINLLLGTRVIN